jgi:flagellar biosynthesis regulator FlaF
MEKESLILAKKLIVEAFNKDKKINKIDKAELLMNLWLYLNEDTYENNNKVLNKELRNGNNYYRKK